MQTPNRSAATRRELRQKASEVVTDCANGPDEYGNYPCDPQVTFGGGWAVCAVCGREGAFNDVMESS